MNSEGTFDLWSMTDDELRELDSYEHDHIGHPRTPAAKEMVRKEHKWAKAHKAHKHHKKG